MNRAWGWAFVGLVTGLALGFAVFQGGLGRASSGPGPQAQERSAIEVRRPPESPEEKERRTLHIAVRGSDGELVEAERAPTGWRLGVELIRRPVRLGQVERDIMRVFQEIRRTGAPMERVTLVVRTDQLKDVYGHPLENVVLARVELSGATFRRVNWDGFDPKNFPRVADDLWLHDELLQQLEERRQAEAGQGQAGGQQSQQSDGGAGGEGGGGGS